jgi:hypothetical protein
MKPFSYTTKAVINYVVFEASTLMNTFINVCYELGVPIAENKTVGPSNIITFLGFIIDTVLMMFRIPEEKLFIIYSCNQIVKPTYKSP